MMDNRKKTGKPGVNALPVALRQGSQGDLLFRNPPPLKSGQNAKISVAESPALSISSARNSHTDSSPVTLKENGKLSEDAGRLSAQKISAGRLETTFAPKDKVVSIAGGKEPTSPKLSSPSKTPPFTHGFSMNPTGNNGDKNKRQRDSSVSSDMQTSVDSSSQTPNPSGR